MRSPRLAGFLLLFLSNVVGGLCFSFITSQRWTAVPAAAAVLAVAYAQWINLGVTVAKFGFDTYLYAALTRRADGGFDLWRFLARYSTLVAFAFALALAPLLGIFAAVLCSAVMLLETAVVLMVTEQSARQRYSVSAISSLLKYPLLFLLLVTLASQGWLNGRLVLLSLTVAALCRFLYTAATRESRPASGPLARLSIWCALNQPLNLVLFRGDQLLLPAIMAGMSAAFVSEYAYLAKWPELVSGVACTAGLVWFPSLWQTLRSLRRGARRGWWKIAVCLTLYVAFIAAATLLYTCGSRTAVPVRLAIPFAAHAALVLPVNFATYLLLRTDHLPGLVCKLLQALSAGLPLWAIGLAERQPLLLAWSIPVQLLTFLAVVALRPWGRRYISHARLPIA